MVSSTCALHEPIPVHKGRQGMDKADLKEETTAPRLVIYVNYIPLVS